MSLIVGQTTCGQETQTQDERGMGNKGGPWRSKPRAWEMVLRKSKPYSSVRQPDYTSHSTSISIHVPRRLGRSMHQMSYRNIVGGPGEVIADGEQDSVMFVVHSCNDDSRSLSEGRTVVKRYLLVLPRPWARAWATDCGGMIAYPCLTSGPRAG